LLPKSTLRVRGLKTFFIGVAVHHLLPVCRDVSRLRVRRLIGQQSPTVAMTAMLVITDALL